jgi:transcriptional regulator with XRE-family HTH domain
MEPTVTDNGRAFNEWLRSQLKAKKMSQRQLAQQSGVDHSTISRLIRGDRMPSLGTATRLARGLREAQGESETAMAIGAMSATPQNPTARVEYALRADDQLSEPQVRQIMEYYLAVRIRRFGRAYSGYSGSGNGHGPGSGSGAGNGQVPGNRSGAGNGASQAGQATGHAPALPRPEAPHSQYRSLVPTTTVVVTATGTSGSGGTDRSAGRFTGPARPSRPQGR